MLACHLRPEARVRGSNTIECVAADIRSCAHRSGDTPPAAGSNEGYKNVRSCHVKGASTRDPSVSSVTLASKNALSPISAIHFTAPTLKTHFERRLFDCFVGNFVPLSVRPYLPKHHSLLSYHLQLGLFNPILMDAYLACACVHMASGTSHWEVKAMQYYNSVLRRLHQTIEVGDLNGDEDWLLLVAVCLCLFEVCLPDL